MTIWMRRNIALLFAIEHDFQLQNDFHLRGSNLQKCIAFSKFNSQENRNLYQCD